MDEGWKGGCACGEVRYRMRSAPMFVHACHCGECRRLTGAAFALNALVESDRVELVAGEPEPAPVTGASGRPQTILRCPRCRTALWSHYAGMGAKVAFVRVGTFDEAERFPPDIHIFASSRLPWLELGDSAPAVAEYYSARDHWPAASLERLDALRGS